jgi:hypothetical protein
VAVCGGVVMLSGASCSLQVSTFAVAAGSCVLKQPFHDDNTFHQFAQHGADQPRISRMQHSNWGSTTSSTTSSGGAHTVGPMLCVAQSPAVLHPFCCFTDASAVIDAQCCEGVASRLPGVSMSGLNLVILE